MDKSITFFFTLFLLSAIAFGQDPGRAPRNVYTTADLDKAPVVTYCELAQNPEMYNEKTVRVRGVYHNRPYSYRLGGVDVEWGAVVDHAHIVRVTGTRCLVNPRVAEDAAARH